MNTYYETYLPIAVIILESKHIDKKYPPHAKRYEDPSSGEKRTAIYRKHKSGEKQHFQGKQYVRDREVIEFNGQLPRLAKQYPDSKKAFVKYGHEPADYSFGKGSKAKRRMEKLKNR